ncbi:MAG: hypothetical protein NUV32_10585, partial [Exilispira sp.]|nr:hypothetical protein [Exilispira sp.]
HFMAGYKQGFDTSCGIAVAASILKFFYNINIDEKSLIEHFFTILSAKKDYTISLLDIKYELYRYSINGQFNLNLRISENIGTGLSISSNQSGYLIPVFEVYLTLRG